ncbi:MAG: hypothetical protein COX77_02945 [Candidatus Komeilibacteria bacterium CG_4_10_14_0_2_um_filter_37_10]|uniref:Glycosyltransferase RgtA/B/C/D-like domain-containing protein n=1 Tax=Candidatus Komeilibacteria bacterium CG_4_10_14_0_2_um_filter_37_10 TaxID=1974470 RepID=A0A2M7VEK5_9BACT|nr:MAG: hypothetical protein COX77_02945 [Candidatus Komeilibacteria bacterium CG_4_10_14_0_2_um_filter_37_10]
MIFIFSLFCFLLYKNISYPLLWNNESETVDTAQQILKFGYPKVHDGKNMHYIPDNNLSIGYKESADANITIPWGNYYFATIGAELAQLTDNIYWKTALNRIPFATIGLIGLLLILLSVKKIFSNRNEYKLFIALFLFLESFSVSLLLTLRTARYYSLTIFILGCFLYIFLNHRYWQKCTPLKYCTLMTLILFCAFNINSAIFLLLVFTILSSELFNLIKSWLQKKKLGNDKKGVRKILNNFLKKISPLLITPILLIPNIIFFETFSTLIRAKEYYHLGAGQYLENVRRIYFYLSNLELFYLALGTKIFFIGIVLYCFYPKKNNKPDNNTTLFSLIKINFFTSYFFILTTLLITTLPFAFSWIVHYQAAQPLLILNLVIDLFTIYHFIDRGKNETSNIIVQGLLTIVICLFFLVNVNTFFSYNKAYFYQLHNQLRGPLDFIIPYIQKNYSNTSDLSIATNYEELSYVYYLNARYLLGYSQINLNEDLKQIPDIVIFRKKWQHNPDAFNYYLSQQTYQKISFPIYDFPTNDIAELLSNRHWLYNHRFLTTYTNNPQDQVEIYIKTKK